MTNGFEIGVGRIAYRSVMGIVRRLLRLREQIITVDDVAIPVWTRAGRGTPLVFIHGFGADKDGWLSLIGKLRGRAIVALDLPGFGDASSIDPSRATAPYQARAVKGVLDALGITNVILVGSSMGGGISLRFASDFPEVTRGVVLLGSVGPAVDKSELGHLLDKGENPLIPSSREDFLGMLDFVAEKKLFVPRAIASYLAQKQVARRPALTAMFASWIAQPPSALEDVLPSIKAPTARHSWRSRSRNRHLERTRQCRARSECEAHRAARCGSRAADGSHLARRARNQNAGDLDDDASFSTIDNRPIFRGYFSAHDRGRSSRRAPARWRLRKQERRKRVQRLRRQGRRLRHHHVHAYVLQPGSRCRASEQRGALFRMQSRRDADEKDFLVQRFKFGRALGL